MSEKNINQLRFSSICNQPHIRLIRQRNIRAAMDRSLNFDWQRSLSVQLDKLAEHADVLKNGATCFVYKTVSEKHTIVIKRYNYKGWLHSLRHTLKGSRAKKSWTDAHRLQRLGIPTPKPLGFAEEYRHGMLYRSWLITEYVEGPKFFQYLSDKSLSKEQKTAVIDQLFSILARMDQNRITHGDLKYSNIVISPTGPVLIDLDSLRWHKTSLFYAYHRQKDQSALDLSAIFG